MITNKEALLVRGVRNILVQIFPKAPKKDHEKTLK